MTPDVLVVGGGPAGLAAAIAARRRGCEVLLADRAVPPIDKACGEGLMPDGIAAAERLGLDFRVNTFAFRGIRFCHGDRSVEASFPHGLGLGIRRTALHEMMVQRAQEAGVRMRWGVNVGFAGEDVLVDGEPVKARWIVGADGGQSAVRRWAGLEQSTRHSVRYGFRRHYRVAPWSEFMELHWGDGCQLYVTPVSAREVCAVLISRDHRLRLDDAMPQFARAAQRLRGARATNLERGGVSVTRCLQSVVRGRVALVGDASGSVDAITGEGLCLLFQQAASLADAIEAGDLSQYSAAHRSIGRRPRWMADLMLTMDRRPTLRTLAMRTMAAHPWTFAGMLRFHVGQFA